MQYSNPNNMEDGICNITASTPEDLPPAARLLLDRFQEERVFAFFAPMGAGKTTFISALCRKLGVGDEVASPTFTIVNEYRASDGRAVYHFDFYRTGSVQEALDIGFEEYMDSDGLCFIEWPEKIDQILPDDVLRVRIAEDRNGSRSVVF